MIVNLEGVGRYHYEEIESVDPGTRLKWSRGLRLLERAAAELESRVEGARAAVGLAAQAARSVQQLPNEAAVALNSSTIAPAARQAS